MGSDASEAAVRSPDELPIFCVVEQSEVYSGLTKAEVARWLQKPCDVLLDYTRNELRMLRDGQETSKRLSFAPHPGKNLVTTAWEMLRIMAENPGTRFTAALFGLHLEACPLEQQTVAKYISKIRSMLGDNARKPEFILRDRILSSAGKSSPAYCSSEERHWRVIRHVHRLGNGDFK